jgi:hypothetical protein
MILLPLHFLMYVDNECVTESLPSTENVDINAVCSKT